MEGADQLDELDNKKFERHVFLSRTYDPFVVNPLSNPKNLFGLLGSGIGTSSSSSSSSSTTSAKENADSGSWMDGSKPNNEANGHAATTTAAAAEADGASSDAALHNNNNNNNHCNSQQKQQAQPQLQKPLCLQVELTGRDKDKTKDDKHNPVYLGLGKNEKKLGGLCLDLQARVFKVVPGGAVARALRKHVKNINNNGKNDNNNVNEPTTARQQQQEIEINEQLLVGTKLTKINDEKMNSLDDVSQFLANNYTCCRTNSNNNTVVLTYTFEPAELNSINKNMAIIQQEAAVSSSSSSSTPEPTNNPTTNVNGQKNDSSSNKKKISNASQPQQQGQQKNELQSYGIRLKQHRYLVHSGTGQMVQEFRVRFQGQRLYEGEHFVLQFRVFDGYPVEAPEVTFVPGPNEYGTLFQLIFNPHAANTPYK